MRVLLTRGPVSQHYGYSEATMEAVGQPVQKPSNCACTPPEHLAIMGGSDLVEKIACGQGGGGLR